MTKLLQMIALGASMSVPFTLYSQTPLTAGDIAITGINATPNTVNGTTTNKEFSFILLKNIASGTSISFTDFGWRSDAAAFQTANPCGSTPTTGAVTDGIVTWTSTSSMSYGTQVLIRCQFPPTASVGSITAMQPTYNSAGTSTLSYVQMSTLGESLIAYTGSFASPNFITGLKCASAGWQTTLLNCTADPISSVRPAALTGNSAFVIPMVELTGDVRLKPSITIPSNPAAALAVIANSANWDMGSVAYVLPPTNPVTPLPLTLISFTAVGEYGRSFLKWNVGSETDVQRYVVERSGDSREWMEIGEVPAKNISGSSYEMTDFSPMQNNLYRLRMEDIDRKITYSNIVTTNLSKQEDGIRIYPTQITNHLTIESNTQVNQQVSITDQLGRLAKTAHISGKTTTVDVADLAPGLYQVRIGRQVFKILK